MDRLPEHSIITFTGKRFWPLEPRPEELDIVDIAHALSNKCRYTGHTQRFYSVAQHSVIVSHVVPPEHALWGLLHDATEAYLPDVSRPVKMQLVGFKEIEDRLHEVISKRFGLPMPMPPSVKDADNIALVTERRDLIVGGWVFPAVHTGGATPLNHSILPLLPGEAERLFLARFAELTSPPVCYTCGDGACPSMADIVKQQAEHLANTP